MSDDQEQQQQQDVVVNNSTDASGNALRGRGGDMMGTDRGPVRGGNFESLRGPLLEVSPQGASSSVEGWVLMLSNLSASATENDLRLLLSDVDPTADLLGDNNNEGNNKNQVEIQFISDLKMNPSAATCGCAGHAFVKVPTFAFAQQVQKLNGQDFVDDMPIRVDFAFQAPSLVKSDADGAQKDSRHHDRDNADSAGPRRPERSDE